MPQMAEKTSPDAPPNCAVVPAFTQREPSPKAEDGPVCAPRIS